MINFVGAGPGAADLITVRGKELIESADVIIYAGSLVNPQLLQWSKDNCKIYNSAEMTLEEIIDIMKTTEREGGMTVRLHTGDPSVYGAIREQMRELDALGIEYNICPGVSSMFGAAASLKAEYTFPGVSQSVIITRMAGRTPVPESESIESLSSHGATMVIFLSAGRLSELSERLISGGYAPDTPAAVVYKATWEDEKIIRTTLSELASAAGNIKKTALVTVGNFLKAGGGRSELYNPEFSHEFRKGAEK